MEWAILTNSANILSHLRLLGYSIPLDIIEKYPTVIRDYLIGEYVGVARGSAWHENG